MTDLALKAPEAVEIAKKQLLLLFKDEQLMNLGLEEIDSAEGAGWNITLGFSRPWNNSSNPISSALSNPRRTYKVVNVSNGGEVLSIKNRD